MDLPELIEQIGAGVDALGQELPANAAECCARMLLDLARWNARMNLTGIRDTEAMVAGHILDSLAVRPLLHGASLIDVGTGAGFPGLPIALAEPQLTVELIDSNARKISFVQYVIGELGIGNARAIRSRAETYAPATPFDTVIARAFASIPRLVEIAGHLVAEKGVMLAQKGRHPADELRAIPEGWKYKVTRLSVPGLKARHVVTLRREGVHA